MQPGDEYAASQEDAGTYAHAKPTADWWIWDYLKWIYYSPTYSELQHRMLKSMSMFPAEYASPYVSTMIHGYAIQATIRLLAKGEQR